MASISINRLTNANVYLEGNSQLGRCESIELPDIKSIFTEHKAIGMVGKPEFWAGLEKLEAKFQWNSFYAETFKTIANPVKTVKMQIRSSLEEYNSGGRGAQVPVVVNIGGQFKDTPLGKYKQHDNTELPTVMAVNYIKLEINGEVIVEVDVLANIYVVAGEDILETYRANLGI